MSGSFVAVVDVVDVTLLDSDSSEVLVVGDNSGQESEALLVDFLQSVILREVLWVVAC